MARKIGWENRIGRRLKLRDLHVFSTVVQRGSMAKAAQHLGVSQPAVSQVIAGLEHALGVRLVDRSSHGIEPTIYGEALLRRSVAVFDELNQGVRDIEFLSDPTIGDVRIACTESLWYAFLPETILRFSKLYPRVKVHADLIADKDFRGLHERRYDCMLQRVPELRFDEHVANELNVEPLFDETVIVVAGAHTKWARRRTIDLAELIDEPWTLGGTDTWNRALANEIFRLRGLRVPEPRVAAVSITLRARLVAAGPYLAAFVPSVLRQLHADHYALVALPVVDLPAKPYSASIATLKNRTLSPVAERFLACVREVAKLFADRPAGRPTRSPKRGVS